MPSYNVIVQITTRRTETYTVEAEDDIEAAELAEIDAWNDVPDIVDAEAVGVDEALGY
jgi:hypothetical protein